MLETDFDEIISTKIVISNNNNNNMENKRQHLTRSTTTQKLLRGSSEEDEETNQVDKDTSEGLKDLIVNDICRQIDIPQTAKFKKWLFPSMLADYVLAQLVIGPLITSCWRSAWLSFNLLIGGPNWISAPICVISGLLLANLLCQTGNLWTSISGNSSRSLRFFLISRSYTICSFGCSMVLWKGAWDLCKLLGFGKNFEVALIVLVLGTLSSAVLRHSRAGVGFPLVFSSADDPSSYYKVGCGEGGWRHCLYECVVFSLVQLSVIASWFGVWNLENRLLEHHRDDLQSSSGNGSAKTTGLGPEAETMLADAQESATASLIIGQTTALLAFLLQFPLLWTLSKPCFKFDDDQSSKSSFLPHLIYSSANLVLSAVAIISSVSNLRGVWMMLDLYFLPGHLILTLCLPLAISLCLLSWLGVLSSLNCHLDPDPGHSQGTGFILRGFYFVEKMAKWSISQKKGQYNVEVA